MALLYDPSPLTVDSKRRAITELLAKTAHDADYYVLLIGAIMLAANAIFADNLPTLIASMIVAPLANPILALGLGITAGSRRLIWRSLLMLAVSSLLAVALALLLTMLIGNDRVVDKYISFSGSRFIAVVVAMVSGAIAAYGMIKPKVASAITGVAIAVSLIPPLAATGVGLAPGGKSAGDAFTLFLLNVLGILVASSVVFALFGMGRAYRALESTPKAAIKS